MANITTWDFQSHWAAFVEAYSDEDEIFLPIVVGWFVSFMTYCIYGGLLLVVDIYKKPEWIVRRRYQSERPYSTNKTSYNPSLYQLLKNVLFNWLVVIPAGLYFLQKIFRPMGLGVYVSKELPTLKEVIFHAVAGPFAVDFFFFYSHWWLHSKAMYARVHKVHHDYKAPHALAAIYAHPFEALVGNTFAVMGPAFFLRLHVLEWYIGAMIGWIGTCTGHSGYDLPWSKKRDGFSDFHDYHHEYFTGNYGSSGLFDYLHGTDSKWRSYCEKRKLAKKSD